MKKKIILFATCSKNFISEDLTRIIKNSNLFEIEGIIFKKKTTNNQLKAFRKKTNYKKIIFRTNKPADQKKIVNFVIKKQIELSICVGFEFIISESFLKLFSEGVINIHPSPLPINRGCHHTFWAIYNGTNHGCAIHYMNNKLDSGDIIDKINFKIREDDTASTLHEKNKKFILKLLKRNLKKIYLNKINAKKQINGSYHSKDEIKEKTILNFSDNIKVNTLFKIIKGTNYGENGYYIVNNSKKNMYLIKSKIFKINKI